ncbi:mitotic checkpoint protein BUB3 [Thecamonas trahens ATCC 50062]|uniref:Mitotic checkpoint protein BUB3 n=1 Tax=Thecamonas trahens ATCC 50062 TaxID=461836 RepID=A0A0L0DUC1_THETB|nr:mitotic checkpoint protein BUB3 [Thecamonas trahens ATCC 50062]KNC55641.1 mitotic checkpoint protein BUB3 [Thecamonas trahens ATCC 50062]|eukprot:XP_013761411.1 mitotic checkpoint protein BUB3 [Thecamonas trahens ATCC 50062]
MPNITHARTRTRTRTRTHAHALARTRSQHVYVYDVTLSSVVSTVELPTPVLDTAYSADGAHLAAATLEGVLAVADVSRPAAAPVASLMAPAAGEAMSQVAYAGEAAAFVTGSWDGSLGMWDPRVGVRSASASAPGKVYALDISGHRVVAATAGRHVYVYDVRNFSEPVQKRESSLKHQTRAVAASPSGDGFALSSIEGRVAIEYFDPEPAIQARKFAFKCHRAKPDPVKGTPAIAYPVNALAFHPTHGTLATGGCDACINVWDPAHKRRLASFGPFQTSLAALAFSPSGDALALATSYTFELGERDAPPDAIFVMPVTDAKFKSRGPKGKKK